MKKIAIAAGVVLILIGLVWWGRSNQINSVSQAGAGAGAITAAETMYDFETISMQDGLVDHVFIVTNSSREDVQIRKVTTSCMCTKAYIESADGEKGPFGMESMGYVPPANEMVRSGESRRVRVVYDPNAHGPAGVGRIDRFVYLADDSGGTLDLEIRALVTP